MSLQKCANRLVRDAASQLAPYAGTGLPIVIALDNYRQKGISLDKHTLGALFGEPQVQITIDATTGDAVSEAWVRPTTAARSRAGETVILAQCW
jgi:hypothetical protein